MNRQIVVTWKKQMREKMADCDLLPVFSLGNKSVYFACLLSYLISKVTRKWSN